MVLCAEILILTVLILGKGVKLPYQIGKTGIGSKKHLPLSECCPKQNTAHALLPVNRLL